jgi:hypothetical protein
MEEDPQEGVHARIETDGMALTQETGTQPQWQLSSTAA